MNRSRKVLEALLGNPNNASREDIISGNMEEIKALYERSNIRYSSSSRFGYNTDKYKKGC